MIQVLKNKYPMLHNDDPPDDILCEVVSKFLKKEKIYFLKRKSDKKYLKYGFQGI